MSEEHIDIQDPYDETQGELRARAMRESLDQFDLDEEDLALLNEEFDYGDEVEDEFGLPVLAVIGRPNVGKSTLVNRIIGRREAVVQDTPGVTRDRVSYPAEWAGRRFTLVDTGGWEIDVKGIDRSVAQQAEVAVDCADAVLFVVDATVGMTQMSVSFQCFDAAASRSYWPRTRSTQLCRKPRQLICGPLAWESLTQSLPYTGEEPVTCSMQSWLFFLRSPLSLQLFLKAVPVALRSSDARMSVNHHYSMPWLALNALL